MRTGFTVIELMIVIAIVGLLVAISVVSFNTSRAKARDTQRVHDINQIRSALELYYDRFKSYPTAITTGRGFAVNNQTYLDTVPANPAPRTDGDCPNVDYTYIVKNGYTDYYLNFCLSKAAGDMSAGTHSCNNSACSSYAYDADAENLFTRFSGTLTTTDRHNINNLIVAAKEHGWWNKMDVFYMFAVGTNATDAKMNWKSTSYTASGSPTWTAYRGFAGDGTTYLDTTYNPNTNGVNYTLNSASAGIYSLSNISASTVEMGASTGGLANRIEFALRFGGNAYIAMNDNATSQASSDSRGLWIGSRTGASSFFVMRNGGVFFTPNTAATNLANFTVYIGGMNVGGAPQYRSTQQIASAFLGGGLTTAEASVVSIDINNYLTSVGANTY